MTISEEYDETELFSEEKYICHKKLLKITGKRCDEIMSVDYSLNTELKG